MTHEERACLLPLAAPRIAGTCSRHGYGSLTRTARSCVVRTSAWLTVRVSALQFEPPSAGLEILWSTWKLQQAEH